MSRDLNLYLDDILQSVKNIEKYTAKCSFAKFKQNSMMVDAVVRNLEIIGEAVKNIPWPVRQKHKEIEWRKIVGLRDTVIHAYFGVDTTIIWDVVKNKLPGLKASIREIKKLHR